MIVLTMLLFKQNTGVTFQWLAVDTDDAEPTVTTVTTVISRYISAVCVVTVPLTVIGV
jgi:hypothetical protein